MIALKDMNSKLYSDVTGTDYDPFYNDKKIPALLKHLNPNWKFSEINEARSFETFDDKHLKMWLNINWTTARVGDQFAKELKAAAAEAKKRGLKWMTEEMISNDKLKEQVSLKVLRTMKIVSLATGCIDTGALYEYALTSPTYSSLVELKENFNKYIQGA
jgi:hypothetical protein